MDESSYQKLTGTVVFLKSNEGSKSEAVVPFLYRGRDMPLQRIMRKDDNPFENRGFVEYDGKVVDLYGELSNGKTFIATKVDLSVQTI